MKTRESTVLFVLVALTGLLAAGPARADRFSFGFGVSNGEGSQMAFGLSSGGHGHEGRSYHGHGHGDTRLGFGYSMCPPPVVFAPRPFCRPAPVVCLPPPPVVVVRSGYWQERDERYWVEGYWSETTDACGRRCRVWQPGRWEIRRIREWVR